MKIFTIILFSLIMLNANGLHIDKKAVNELLNYSLKLPNNIYDPFVVKKEKKKIYIKDVLKKNKQVKVKLAEKKLDLLAILNNKALVKIEGIDVEKWLKKGQKIEEYTLKKIINSNSILVSIRNKIKIITIKNNNFNIKVK